MESSVRAGNRVEEISGMKERIHDVGVPGTSGKEAAEGKRSQEETRRPDPEVSAKASRRKYNAEYKLKILRQIEQMAPKERNALLRREGLFRSHLNTWTRQAERGELEGLSPRKRGRKANPHKELIAKCTKLERENERLRRKIEGAETIIEFQKKMAELLKKSEEIEKEG